MIPSPIPTWWSRPLSPTGGAARSMGEIGLRVEMTREEKNMRFSIHVNPADLLLLKRGATYEGSVGFMLATYHHGFLTGATAVKNVDLNLTQEQYDRAMKDGVQLTEVAPGNQQIETIRAMVYDRSLQALGSVTMLAEH